MGFFDGLKEFNDTMNKIDNAKASVKKGVDKKSRSEDEKSDIRKSNIWSTINLILTLGFGVAAFLFLKDLFDFLDIMSGVVIIGIVVIALVISIGKALNFTKDNVVGFGAIFYSYFVLAVFVLMVFLSTLGRGIIPI